MAGIYQVNPLKAVQNTAIAVSTRMPTFHSDSSLVQVNSSGTRLVTQKVAQERQSSNDEINATI